MNDEHIGIESVQPSLLLLLVLKESLVPWLKMKKLPWLSFKMNGNDFIVLFVALCAAMKPSRLYSVEIIERR